ncbi:hypothetical protein G6L13_27335 [Agrobacterium tumefaciens]|uniref:hypothetical protein n=1 Tax=Agrobacterium tumefaciens TaxID=358 RepID=UPI001574331B|nr:hypothetical protein [Agrobacterium tumefaciens]NTA84194.1 hypothetical protein [Agrobacterium tumefaciens]
MPKITYKLLRLSRGKRYVIAVQDQNGEIEPHPYWEETQAFFARRTPVEQWEGVRTEVFKQVFPEALPEGYSAFVRMERRNVCLGVVLWRGAVIYPLMFSTLEEAISAAVQDERVCEAQAKTEFALAC